MKAAVFRGAGQKLSVESVADPAPGHRQVVLKVHTCGICGTDLTMTSGHGVVHWQPGDIPGHEYSGEVVALGSGVESLSVGDRVSSMAIYAACGHCDNCRTGNEAWCTGTDKSVGCAFGFAEYAVVGEAVTVKLPDELSWDDGALVEPIAVGLHGVDLSDIRPGASVAVLGAGSIALPTVYWARRRGAGRIVVVARSNRREKLARLMGATDFVSGENAVEAVHDLCGGPPSVVFEAAGTPGVLATAIDMVAPRGTVTVLGACSDPDTFVPILALMKQVRVQFSFVYGSLDFIAVMEALASDPEGPRLMVTDRVSLEELPDVFESLRGPTTSCKVLMRPSA
jgi:threonine dehydrogenase-like Zn-dependent dehydrogenase